MGMLKRKDATAVIFGVFVPWSKIDYFSRTEVLLSTISSWHGKVTRYSSYSSSMSSFTLIWRTSTASQRWENVNLLFMSGFWGGPRSRLDKRLILNSLFDIEWNGDERRSWQARVGSLRCRRSREWLAHRRRGLSGLGSRADFLEWFLRQRDTVSCRYKQMARDQLRQAEADRQPTVATTKTGWK